jgi:hypothetical protein
MPQRRHWVRTSMKTSLYLSLSHYVDPRLCDDLPTETAAYNERCREIAREMFYIMSLVRRQHPPAIGG